MSPNNGVRWRRARRGAARRVQWLLDHADAAHVFAHGPRRAVREVCVGGVSRVTEGRPVHGTAAWERFIAARAALLAGG